MNRVCYQFLQKKTCGPLVTAPYLVWKPPGPPAEVCTNPSPHTGRPASGQGTADNVVWSFTLGQLC